jgi:hypothetical protein
MASLTCPRCLSPKLRRSRTKDYIERALKSVGRKTYRCEECDWRGFVKRKNGEIRYHEENDWTYKFVKVFSSAALALIAILLIFYVMRSLIQ